MRGTIKVWWTCGCDVEHCTAGTGRHDEYDACESCVLLNRSVDVMKEVSTERKSFNLRLLGERVRQDHDDRGATGVDQEQHKPLGDSEGGDGGTYDGPPRGEGEGVVGLLEPQHPTTPL